MIPDFLFYLFAFVVALGTLITLHEFGHFWVARKLGVKVLRFSVGFGKPLVKWVGKRDGTEYVVAGIPLGGYVKMLDEREGEVAEHERGRAFNNQSLGVRSAIVAAGPIFNFLFAILAYWLVFWVGEDGIKPFVGEVADGSPAMHAGFETGDEILSVGDTDTSTWEMVILALMSDSSQRTIPIKVRDESGKIELRSLSGQAVQQAADEARLYKGIGFEPMLPDVPAVIGRIIPGEAAANGGLEVGDRILAMNGDAVEDWKAWVVRIKQNPETQVTLLLERDGNTLEQPFLIGSVIENDALIGRIGAAPQRVDISDFQRHYSLSVFPALGAAMSKTAEMSWLTLRMMGRMLIGEASIKNLSGPITIAQYAGETASLGLIKFLKFLAIVSVSLGVINLLPVPVLDGGHLFYFAIEAIRGKPLSESIQIAGQKFGIVLLLMLMGIAFYVDLGRLLG